MDKFKILNVIIGLNIGGAEMMLLKLLSSPRFKELYSSEVISLTSIGPVGRKLQDLGIKVRALGLSSNIGSFGKLNLLSKWIKEARPNLVQTWMYHGDLLGGVAARLSFPRAPIVWNIRNSELGAGITRTVLTRSLAFLSAYVPSVIISNSFAGYVSHVNIGYDKRKMVVIPNGFDVMKFRPQYHFRHVIREELNINEDSIVIGLVGRYAPEKNHSLFLRASRRVVSEVKNVVLVLCGHGVSWDNDCLVKEIEDYGLRDYCRLLGRRDDIAAVMNALDILALSSNTEGFPNVVGEAMACEVPCLVTNSGDCATIVGDTGKVVPVGDEGAFAKALCDLASLERSELRRLGIEARKRIVKRYSLDAIVNEYIGVYQNLIE